MMTTQGVLIHSLSGNVRDINRLVVVTLTWLLIVAENLKCSG